MSVMTSGCIPIGLDFLGRNPEESKRYVLKLLHTVS